MKYIVWDLISPYDGYGTTECMTWEEAVAVVREICFQPHNKKYKSLTQFKNWQAGKQAKIEGQEKDGLAMEVFVTTAALTGPVNNE